VLCMNSYDRGYIEQCRSRIDAQIAGYRALVAAGAALRGQNKAQFDAAADAFEPVFFNNLVLVLDGYFVHRTRGLEKKDGNPLNEARLLCNSIMTNNGKLVADKQIRLDPATSLLGYAVGDEIKVRESDFVLLAKGFFAEIESKFM
jgi:hypothetical protein